MGARAHGRRQEGRAIRRRRRALAALKASWWRVTLAAREATVSIDELAERVAGLGTAAGHIVVSEELR